MTENERIIAAILSGRANDQFGLRPYKPGYDFPQDVGMGGPSTEYVATDYDPQGQVMNYPQVWYDQQGMANLLPPDQAMSQALAYENGSAMTFPRFNSIANADTFAANRSMMGGAEKTPLASLFGLKNY